MEVKEHDGSNRRRRKSLATGLFVISIGVIWLLRRMGHVIPNWLFDWPMILIYIGFFIGISKNFKSTATWILFAIGGFGLLSEYYQIPIELKEYFWPIMVIIAGIIITFRPRHRGDCSKHKKFEHYKYDKTYYSPKNPSDTKDRIDMVSVFNGIKKTIVSKNFKGGDTVTLFGGTEINLMHADFEETINLDCVVIFGGLKLIVPPGWDVRVNTTNILGGTEDKRTSAVQIIPEDKILVITGVVIFGGLDITSF